MAFTYTEVRRFPKSNGLGEWTVKMRNDGVLTCNCPVWMFSKGRAEDRRCKHTIRTVEDGYADRAAGKMKKKAEREERGVYIEI